MSDGAEITPEEIYNDGEIIIKLVGIGGTADSPSLAFAVRNGTKETLHFSPTYLRINGCTMNCYLDKTQLSKHTVTMVTMDAYNSFSPLDPYGDTVWSVDLSMDLYDDDYNGMGTVVFSGNTTSYTGEEEPITLEGYSLLNQDGFVVNALALDIDETTSSMTLYFQNDSDRYVYVSTNHVFLNGTEVALWFWNELDTNTRTLETSYIYDKDSYDDIILSDEDELSFELEVTDFDSSEVLISKNITINVGELNATLNT